MFSALQNLLDRLTSKKQNPVPQPLTQNQPKENTCLKKTAKKPEKNQTRNPQIKIDKPPQNKKKSKPEKPKTSNLDKNKIPILEKNVDFSKCFKEPALEKPGKKPKKPLNTKNGKKKKRKKNKPVPVNKNKIPILDKEDDLSKYFLDIDMDSTGSAVSKIAKSRELAAKDSDDESFEELIEKSLANKDTQILLQEKYKGSVKDKPLSKKQIIKTFPLVQEELDLHGHTAAEALEKNEAFIRKEYQKGKRTLLVIVGKGTHTRGRAVLPDVIENQIVELKRKNIVLAFEWDKGVKRKSGAIIVYLNTG